MRIQVLHLPGHTAGEFQEDRFALVVDQVDDEQIETLGGVTVRASRSHVRELMIEFGHAIGAQGVLVMPETVEVV